MRRTMLMLASVVCLIVLASVLISRDISAQDVADSVYFPYPPGVIPPDLVPEIARVNREVNLIETESLAQWHALPINSGTAMRQVQRWCTMARTPRASIAGQNLLTGGIRVSRT